MIIFASYIICALLTFDCWNPLQNISYSTLTLWLYGFVLILLCYVVIIINLNNLNTYMWIFLISCYAPARREGGSKLCFCPSVCPSVAYIANNSRTQRPSVPKFGMKVPPPLMRLAHQIQGQKVKVTSPLMFTHILRHIFQSELTAYRWLLVSLNKPLLKSSWQTETCYNDTHQTSCHAGQHYTV